MLSTAIESLLIFVSPLTPGSGTGLLLRRTAKRKSTFEAYPTLSVPVPCNRLLAVFGFMLLRSNGEIEQLVTVENTIFAWLQISYWNKRPFVFI